MLVWEGGEKYMLKSVKTRVAIIASLIVLSLALVGGTALAAKPSGDTRPGNGWGDKNHTHTGPPGQTTHPVKNK